MYEAGTRLKGTIIALRDQHDRDGSRPLDIGSAFPDQDASTAPHLRALLDAALALKIDPADQDRTARTLLEVVTDLVEGIDVDDRSAILHLTEVLRAEYARYNPDTSAGVLEDAGADPMIYDIMRETATELRGGLVWVSRHADTEAQREAAREEHAALWADVNAVRGSDLATIQAKTSEYRLRLQELRTLLGQTPRGW